MMGPFEPVLMRNDNIIKTGSNIKIAMIDKNTSTILW